FFLPQPRIGVRGRLRLELLGGRRCTPASRRASPATPAAAAPRPPPQAHQARGDRLPDGRQIVERGSARDQDADRQMKKVEKKARVAASPPEPRRLTAADEEGMQLLVARLRGHIPQEIEEGKTT